RWLERLALPRGPIVADGLDAGLLVGRGVEQECHVERAASQPEDGPGQERGIAVVARHRLSASDSEGLCGDEPTRDNGRGECTRSVVESVIEEGRVVAAGLGVEEFGECSRPARRWSGVAEE